MLLNVILPGCDLNNIKCVRGSAAHFKMASKRKNKESEDKPHQVPKSSSLTSLQFPRPHQLGLSTGIHLSRSSRGTLGHAPSVSAGEVAGGHPLPGWGRGEDQVDFAGAPPPLPRKTARLAPMKYRKKKDLLQPLVKTYDESPLTEFVLYLPPKLPSSILHSKLALSDFVINTALTYISLWDLAKDLQALNLRFPAHYVEKLSEDSQFLSTFLESVFDQLGKVKSVEELLLPKVILHTQTGLVKFFQSIVASSFSVTHLFLPMKSNLPVETLEQFDFKILATNLRKARVKHLTFISSDEVVKEFSDKLSSEMKPSKKNGINVSYSSHDLGAPGPNYITEMDQPVVAGESVDPLILVGSLNVPEESGTSRSSDQTQKLPKRVCAYYLFRMLFLFLCVCVVH